MTFKEQLKIAENNNLSILDLEIADECDCVFEFEYTDGEYEALCNTVKRAYLKAEDMTITALAYCINDLINNEVRTIQQVCDLDVWDLLKEAAWYL